LHVYPNPVIRSRDERPTVTIAGLVSGSTIKIYTVSGKLIKTIDASSLGSTATWDGRDENGDELSSGVYILGATSELATESGQAKFVLIHK
jgi:flagellar hook assembly protein FlgD